MLTLKQLELRREEGLAQIKFLTKEIEGENDTIRRSERIIQITREKLIKRNAELEQAKKELAQVEGLIPLATKNAEREAKRAAIAAQREKLLRELEEVDADLEDLEAVSTQKEGA